MLRVSISHDRSGRSRPASRLYERVRRVIPPIEWPVFEADIEAILRLKRERDAIILAHNYQSPEIFHCVADAVGDSLALAREAAKSDARVIVMAGVHFMAETAKLLNPSKTVLIPDARAGCSLAESIDADDIRLMRQGYPGAPVVTYVNTSAAVKAASDICCTSANAVKVVESLGAPRVIMIPDEYLAKNVAAQTKVEIIAWRGRCEVHEQFTAADIRELREAHPDAVVLAHPECAPEVVAEADFAGSTAEMIGYVDAKRPARVALVTECSMSDNVAVNYPDVEFVRPCGLCPHMKRITLAKIRHALETLEGEVTIDPVDRRARAPRRREDARAMSAEILSLRGRVVIVGAGIAGLMTALELAPRPVVVLSKGPLGAESSTLWAQGGLAAAMGASDSPALHAADTLAAGDGLGDAAIVDEFTRAAPAAIVRLARLGVRFDRADDGGFALGLEAAHAQARIVHAGGDGAGRELMRALIAAARATPSIDILEGFEARRLIVDDNAVCGVLAVGPAGPALLAASRVVIATGGIGGLFEESTNPLGSFGQGVALAARAGAALADMEFVQFHPTALDVAARPMPLVSEAVRGAGATLIDETGQRFMARYARRGIGAARRGRARDLAPARGRPSRVSGRAQSDRR